MNDFQPSDVGMTLELITQTLAHFATDFFAFLVVGAVVAAFAFYFGRDRIVPLIAALYASIPLYTLFPYDTTSFGGDIVSLALWVLIVLLGLVAFSGLASFVASGSIGLFKVIILSAATAGLIIAIAIHILPVDSFYTFSPPTMTLFDSAEAFFFWLVAPLAGIFLFGRG